MRLTLRRSKSTFQTSPDLCAPMAAISSLASKMYDTVNQGLQEIMLTTLLNSTALPGMLAHVYCIEAIPCGTADKVL